MKLLFFPIFFLFFISANIDNIFSQELKKIQFKNSPTIDFAKDLEMRFIEIFPILYFENKIYELTETEREKIVNLLRDKDLGSCFNVEEGILKDFCKFYVALNLIGVDSDDLDNFKDSLLIDLGRLARSISFLKKGEFIQSEKFFNEITDKSIKIFFSDLDNFFKAKDIDKVVNSKKINVSAKKVIIYRLLEEDPSLLIDNVKGYIDEYHYNYLMGVNLFKKRNFLEAGNFFLNSSKNEDIKEISLYNAIYCFILAKNFKTASKIIPYLNVNDAKMFTSLISLANNNLKGSFVYDDFADNKDFWFLLKHIVKYRAEQDGNINFLRYIKMSDIKDDEELLFFYCINLLITDKQNLDNRCKNHNWKIQEYSNFFKDISDNIINRRENIKILESYKLYNYYPFSKFYGDYLFRNSNLERAKSIYEEIIKVERNLKSDDLINIYLGLSKIYRANKSFFTAKKVIDEAIDKLSDKKDLLRLEQLRILEEEKNCEETLWRAMAYLNETEDEEIKKELQKFIEMCYERLDKLNKREK